MAEPHIAVPELPNIISVLSNIFYSCQFLKDLRFWESTVFSAVVIMVLSGAAFIASRRIAVVPGRGQAAIETFVGGFDGFIYGILGPRGRKFTPFIGTLFIYILTMNLLGMVPFMKSPTASWSVTLALALCVFIYLQYTALKELGFSGYLYHLLGRPKGILAFSVFIPLLMLFLHILSELIRPISLSLRLRSNIWGDEMLLAVLANFGIKAVPLLVFNMALGIVAAFVQAVVFCLLTTIYFALISEHE